MLANGQRDHITTISGNRTLLADRFTYEPAAQPQIIQHLQSFLEIFNWFKPALPVELEDERGLHQELLHFHCLEDFDMPQIARQSKLLQQLTAQQESLLRMPDTERHAIAIRELDEYIQKNQQTILAAMAPLEQAYRSLALFFRNARQERITNLSLLNATPDQLRDTDVTSFRDAVAEELKNHYDRLDLRYNYSLLILPCYLPAPVLDSWARIAYNNKVLLITTFGNFNQPDDVIELFAAAGHTGATPHLANVVMTCNWLIGRKRYGQLEAEECYLPPATAYAGRIYQSNMSQMVAGKKQGCLLGAYAVRFTLKKAMIAHMEKLGLVPMIAEYGEVRACAGKTLFVGDSKGLQLYTVVRVFDYITKVVIDFLNRHTFENFNARTKKEIIEYIARFLDMVTGTDKLIEHFNIQRFEQHAWQKDIIYLDIELKPFFPSKNYLIRLNGQKKDEKQEWQSEYEENGVMVSS